MLTSRYPFALLLLLLAIRLGGQDAGDSTAVAVNPAIAHLDAVVRSGGSPAAELPAPERREVYRLTTQLVRDSLLSPSTGRGIDRLFTGERDREETPERLGLLLELGDYAEADSLLAAYSRADGPENLNTLREAVLLGYRLRLGALGGGAVDNQQLDRAEIIIRRDDLPSWERATLSLRMGQYLASTGGLNSAAIYLQNGIDSLLNSGGEGLDVLHRGMLSLAGVQRRLDRGEAADTTTLRARALIGKARNLVASETGNNVDLLRTVATRQAGQQPPSGWAKYTSGLLPVYYGLALLVIVVLAALLLRGRRTPPRQEPPQATPAADQTADSLYGIHLGIGSRIRSAIATGKPGMKELEGAVESGLKKVPGGPADPDIEIKAYMSALLLEMRRSEHWPGPGVGTDLLVAEESISPSRALLTGLIVATLLDHLDPGASESSDSPWIRVRHYRRDGQWSLLVSDEGNGLPRGNAAVTAILALLARKLNPTLANWNTGPEFNAFSVRYPA